MVMAEDHDPFFGVKQRGSECGDDFASEARVDVYHNVVLLCVAGAIAC